MALGQHVTIPTDWIEQIKKVIAYPANAQVSLSDEQIKTVCVHQAMYEYFRKFPIKVETVYEIGSNNSRTLPFPRFNDDNTFLINLRDVENRESHIVRDAFGITSVFITDIEGFGSNSNFYDLVRYNNVYGGFLRSGTGSSTGNWYNPNFLRNARLAQKQKLASYQNEISMRFTVNPDQEELEIYSDTNGRAVVEWAVASLNFKDVRLERRYEFIELCQSYYIENFVNTVGLVSDGNLGVDFNTDVLSDMATEKKERVTESWRESADIVMIRH